MDSEDSRPIRCRTRLMEWNHRHFLCFLRNKDVPLYYATTIMLPYRSIRPCPLPTPHAIN